jgi:hypothetical protein
MKFASRKSFRYPLVPVMMVATWAIVVTPGTRVADLPAGASSSYSAILSHAHRGTTPTPAADTPWG